jgi:cytochrome c-type biogenesis protein CcmH/NrfF
MKRLVNFAMATLMALVILVPTATAQEMMDESMMMDESNMMDESMMEQPKMMDDSMMMEQPKMEQPKMEQPNSMEKGKMEKGKMQMPMTGGPSLGLLLLPAAALLVGMGLMAGYVVRRRR